MTLLLHYLINNERSTHEAATLQGGPRNMSFHLLQELTLVESITMYSGVLPVLCMEKWREKFIYFTICFYRLRKFPWDWGNGSVIKVFTTQGPVLATITNVKSQQWWHTTHPNSDWPHALIGQHNLKNAEHIN